MAKNKKPHPIFENVTINDIAAEGKAIARINDMIVFVPFVVPGRCGWLTMIARKKSSFMEARLFTTAMPSNVAKRCASTTEFVAVVNGKFTLIRSKYALNKSK